MSRPEELVPKFKLERLLNQGTFNAGPSPFPYFPSQNKNCPAVYSNAPS